MPERINRTLYVGDHVSWDAQWDHAVKLFNEGNTVEIHHHGAEDRCRLDGASSRCGQLTQGTKGPTLDLLSPKDPDN
jgi:hypothetical protein